MILSAVKRSTAAGFFQAALVSALLLMTIVAQAQHNTATGSGALYYNTTGGNNAIGNFALFSNTTGGGNRPASLLPVRLMPAESHLSRYKNSSKHE
jgi:hypothetical protein